MLQDVYAAVEAVQQAGVASWSLDLISGLPHLTAASWEHSLQEAVRLQPDHISVYDLQVLPVHVRGPVASGPVACLHVPLTAAPRSWHAAPPIPSSHTNLDC